MGSCNLSPSAGLIVPIKYADGTLSLIDQRRLPTEEVWIDYQYRPEPAFFPPYFVNLLKHALAAAFAEPITDQITKGDYYHRLAFGSPSENMRGGLSRVAMNIDGVDRPPQNIMDFPLTEVRG